MKYEKEVINYCEIRRVIYFISLLQDFIGNTELCLYEKV